MKTYFLNVNKPSDDIWKSHWEVKHMIGKYDLECMVGNTTHRFFAKDKAQGYSITKQMEYEGEWRVICGETTERNLSEV